MASSNFPENLRNTRLKKKIKCCELAKICNVSAQTYCGWEKGTRNPRISNIRKLCEALEVTADYLLGLSSDDVRQNLFSISCPREPDPLAGLNEYNRNAIETMIGYLLDSQKKEEIEKRKRIVIPFRKHKE